MTIQFHAPLTLIVGLNGSGKTTIIECLKYATTGELPPNSKTGGAFIHDPKLCGEKEVLAQVKLSFKSTSGAKMVATRSLQLTVKKTTRSQKTLEGQLVMVKDGERTAISSRVAELDQILPQYLGVSKAILESVIFCHQEESLWPMSEPKALKNRFDEIFEALKYSKAVDNIKILRKKQNEDLAKFRIHEQHAKENKERGDRAEKRSTELFDEIESLRAQESSLREKITDATQKSEEAWNHAAKFEKIVAGLEGKRIERRAIEKNVKELEANLKTMHDTDNELQSILDQYQERIALYEEDRETNRSRYSDLSTELENDRRALGIKQSEVGKFEAQKDHYERQVERRENLIKETARRHSIRGFDFEVTDEHVRDFMEKITKMSRDQNNAFERARRATQDALNKAQNVLSQLNERKAALNQSKEASRAQITTNDRKIVGFQQELDKIEVDEGSEAVLKSNKDDVDRRLHKTKEDYKNSDWDKQLQKVDAQIRTSDDKNQALNAELIEGTRQASQTAELDVLRKNLRETERNLTTVKDVYAERISNVVGRTWTLATLEQSFQTVLDEKNSEVRDIEKQREGTNRELEHVQFKLKSVRNDLAKKTSELQKCQKTVQDAIGDKDVSDFETELQELEDEYEEALANQEGFKFVQGWYKKALKTSKDENACHMCERKFGHAGEKRDFNTKIERLVQQAIEKAEKDVTEAAAEELERVKRARPSYDLLIRLQDTEIPALKSEEDTLRSRNEILEGTAEQQDNVLLERQSSRKEVESLSKTIQSIVKYHAESNELDRKITALAVKQEDAGMSRGLEKIQEDLKEVGEQSKSMKSRLNQMSAERDRSRSTINTLELEARDIQSQISTASYQLKEKASLTSRIDEIKSHSSEQRDAIQRLDEDMRNLVPQIEQAQIKYDDINRRGAEEDRELQQKASRLSDSVRQLQQADQDINDYIDKGGPQQLSRTRREIENLEGEVSGLENEMRQVAVQIKKIEEHLRDTDDTKRAINDNLRFRRGKRDLEALYAEIEQLESHNAESDKNRYDREGQKWQLERNRLTAEQASIIGEIRSKDDQLKELIDDYETEYKDAAYKYREAHIKVETTKAAVEDLGRYGGALDKAIMKYHAIKMEEINRIVEELWRKTYQGTDVDTIAIRSDNENLKGNKSYNYRVVMVKQDAEMDMRGRCSAGQKVLASIIIRLALAECFGVNCGLIALDEPTTNLDRENIQALAEALAEIIKVRRQQSNFQLIVITHDEDFLKYMQCADFCDTYYRVYRNDRQKSVIERQSIAEVV